MSVQTNEQLTNQSRPKKETAKKIFYKEILSQKVLDILLNPDLQNPNTPIGLSSIISIEINELETIYKFLVSGVIEINASIKGERPKCPMTHPKQASIARHEYRQGMINYILKYNVILKSFACKYSVAFLEVFANYCEFTSKKGLKIN